MVTLNGHNVVKGRFPNNEVDYKPWNGFDFEIHNNATNKFELIFESNEDLFNLQVIKKMFDDKVSKKTRAGLHILFFPYSQMDREMSSHGFSLKYVAQIINDMNFDYVKVYDPHSNVLPALLNKCFVEYPIKSFLDADAHINNCSYDLLFFPDNGAAKKYVEVLNCKNYRFGNKKRNLETGEIECYEVIANKEDIEGKRILIVDDLCMGGRTFVEAAKALREMGAAKVELYVTHLMPQARNFYNTKGNGLIDEIHSADTLNLIETFNTPEPRP